MYLCNRVNKQTNRHMNERRVSHNLICGGNNDIAHILNVYLINSPIPVFTCNCIGLQYFYAEQCSVNILYVRILFCM